MARDVNVGPAAEKKLERYGVWVKVEPRDVTRDLGGSVELTDLESRSSEGRAGRASFTDEEEHLLDELETGVGHEVAAGTQVELESLDERLPPLDSDEDLPELELEDAVEAPLTDNTPGAGRFDDLESIEGGTHAAGRRRGPSGNPLAHRAGAALDTIRPLRPEEGAGRPAQAQALQPARRGAGTGPKAAFFEEEDDDTIALTGDELDNILNTADITEEAAEAPAAEEILAEVGDAGPLPGPRGHHRLRRARGSNRDRRGTRGGARGNPRPGARADGIDPCRARARSAGDAPVEAGELPSFDLEAIPEIEGIGEAELEELPAGDDADLIDELEKVPAAPGPKRSPSTTEIDLEAPADAQDAGGEPILSTADLAASDLAELEAVAEEPAAADGAPIEIDFEQAAAPAGAGAAAAEAEALEEIEELEEVAEGLEEVAEEPEQAPAAAGPVSEPEPPRPARQQQPAPVSGPGLVMNAPLKNDLRNVLGVIDELLDALPGEEDQGIREVGALRRLQEALRRPGPQQARVASWACWRRRTPSPGRRACSTAASNS